MLNKLINVTMRLVIGFIFLVTPCLTEYHSRSQTNQSIQNDCNVIQTVEPRINNQGSVEKQRQNANTTAVSTSQISATKQGPCRCSGGMCACCSRLLFDVWKQKACVNVTYDPDEFSFTTKVMMNDNTLYTRTISGKNPRPICVPVPRFPTVRACVRFYNIYFQGRNVHACINMEGKFRDTRLFTVGLDCVRFGAKGVAIVKPEDGGGLGQIEFLPGNVSGEDDDDDYDDDDYDDADDDDDLFDY